MANTSIYNENWFNEPQGSDYPSKLYKACGKWRICRLARAKGWLEAKVQAILDSQQPRLVLRTKQQESGWRLVIPPLPELSAARRQDKEEAGYEDGENEDVEMTEDFQEQRAPSEPREYDEPALQLYRVRQRSRSPEDQDLSLARGYRDRHSPRHDVATTASSHYEGEDVQAFELQCDELRLRELHARQERFRAEEESAAIVRRQLEQRLRQACEGRQP